MLRFRAERCALLLVCATAAGLGAGAVNADTLTEALEAAYVGNPILAAQREHLRQVGEKISQARSHWGPSVGISADTGVHSWRQETDSSDFVPQNFQSATLRQRDVALEVTQPLFRGGRTVAETRAMQAAFAAEQARTASLEQTVLESVAESFVAVLRDRAIVELQHQNERALSQELEGARARLYLGQLTRTDVAQAEARLAGGVADLEEAQGNLRVSMDRYEQYVGRRPEAFVAPAASIFQVPQALESAEKAAGSDNPDVLAARYDQDSAQHNISVVRGQLLPAVDLVIDVTRNDNALIRTPTLANPSRLEGVSALVRITVPLYDGGNSYSQVRAARDAWLQTSFSLEATTRAALDKARAAWEALRTAQKRTVALQKQIETNTIALRGAHLEHVAGTRTLLDVLNAEQELLTSNISLEKTQYDSSVASFQIAVAMGRFTAREIGLPGAAHAQPGAESGRAP